MSSQENYDESVYMTGSNYARASVSDTSKTWILSAIMAFCLVGVIFMYVKWRDAAMESRLQQYNLDWFKTHEFADLKAIVEVQKTEILALQVAKACKEK